MRELQEYCALRNWTVVSEYVDEGVSGSKESRPQLNRLMADARRRRLDAVLCWKIDRFGRSLKHLVKPWLRQAHNRKPSYSKAG